MRARDIRSFSVAARAIRAADAPGQQFADQGAGSADDSGKPGRTNGGDAPAGLARRRLRASGVNHTHRHPGRRTKADRAARPQGRTRGRAGGRLPRVPDQAWAARCGRRAGRFGRAAAFLAPDGLGAGLARLRPIPGRLLAVS